MKAKRLLALLAAGPLLGGCPLEGVLDGVDQSSLCLYTTDEQARSCKDGQLAYFKPATRISTQAALNVATAYCDFKHQILISEGGVACVFTNQRLHLIPL